MIDFLVTVLLLLLTVVATVVVIAFVVGAIKAVILAIKLRKTKKQIAEALEQGNPLGALNDLFKGLG